MFRFCSHCLNIYGRFHFFYIWKVSRTPFFFPLFIFILNRHRSKEITDDIVLLLFKFTAVYNFILISFGSFRQHFSVSDEKNAKGNGETSNVKNELLLLIPPYSSCHHALDWLNTKPDGIHKLRLTAERIQRFEVLYCWTFQVFFLINFYLLFIFLIPSFSKQRFRQSLLNLLKLQPCLIYPATKGKHFIIFFYDIMNIVFRTILCL